MTDILLCSPFNEELSVKGNFTAPPLGVHRMASWLRAHGHHAEVYDFNLGGDFAAVLASRHWQIIGFSSLQVSLAQDIRAAQQAKAACPGARIIFGGLEATLNYQDVLDCAPCDLVALGEGEQLMLDLANGKPLAECSGYIARKHAMPTTPAEFAAWWESIDFRAMRYEEYWAQTRALEPEAADEVINTVRLVTSSHCNRGCAFCSVTRWHAAACGRTVPTVALTPEQVYRLVCRVQAEVPSVKTVYFCLPPGEPVFTTEGLVPIEDAEKIGSIYAGGKVGKITDTLRRRYVGKMATIRVALHNQPLRCTEGHRVWGWLRGNEQPGWHEAREFTEGDHIGMPIATSSEPLPVDSKWEDPDFWRWLGLWVAEGHASKYQVYFSFNKNEGELRQFAAEGFSRFFALEAHINETGTATQVYANSVRLSELLVNICNTGARRKRVPPGVFSAGDECRAAFLRGLFEGDGSVISAGKRRGIRLATYSSQLAYEVADILRSLRWCPGVYCFTKKPSQIGGRTIKGGATSCEVRLNTASSFDEILAGPQNGHHTSGRSISAFHHEGYVYHRVRSITMDDYDGPVYNLTVLPSHSYRVPIAEVKNCEDDFIVTRERAYQAFELLGKTGLNFLVQTRLDKLTEGLVQHMAANGCSHITIGVENASQDVLRAFGKPQKLEMVSQVIRWCIKVGVTPYVLIILFGPSATRRDLEINYEQLSRWIAEGAVVSIEPNMRAYRGSPLWDSGHMMQYEVTKVRDGAPKVGRRNALRTPTRILPDDPEARAIAAEFNRRWPDYLAAANESHEFKGATGKWMVSLLGDLLRETEQAQSYHEKRGEE